MVWLTFQYDVRTNHVAAHRIQSILVMLNLLKLLKALFSGPVAADGFIFVCVSPLSWFSLAVRPTYDIMPLPPCFNRAFPALEHESCPVFIGGCARGPRTAYTEFRFWFDPTRLSSRIIGENLLRGCLP